MLSSGMGTFIEKVIKCGEVKPRSPQPPASLREWSLDETDTGRRGFLFHQPAVVGKCFMRNPNLLNSVRPFHELGPTSTKAVTKHSDKETSVYQYWKCRETTWSIRAIRDMRMLAGTNRTITATPAKMDTPMAS